MTLAALGVAEHPRDRLAAELDVAGWLLPGQPPPPPTPAPEPGVPAWWQGDEQASASFLAAMGVQL